MQVVVVLSGSMEPGFYRGDIFFLYKGQSPFRTGEVVVFNLEGRETPIVHPMHCIASSKCMRSSLELGRSMTPSF